MMHRLCLLTIFLIFAFISCDLNPPSPPVHDNPWDPENPNPPRTPGNTFGSVLSERSLRVNWSDMSGNEKGFVIFNNLDSLSTYSYLDSVSQDCTNILVFDLNSATSYYFKVFAFNDAGSSPFNAPYRLSTAEVAPSAPSNIESVAISITEIEVSWTDNSANEIRFIISHTLDTTLTDQIPENITEATSSPYTFTGVQTFTTLYFKIAAENEYGLSSSTEWTWATPGALPPEPPSSLTAEPISEVEILLNWLDNSDNEEGFEIFVSERDSLNFVTYADLEVDSDSCLIEIENPEAVYFFKVQAYNPLNKKSFYSNIASATTLNAPPALPADFSGRSISETEVSLSWRDRSRIETGFEIAESIGSEENFQTIVFTDPDSESLILTDKVIGTVYYYKIRTVGQAENSPWSNAISLTGGSLPPEAPGNLRGEAISTSQIMLYWDDLSDNEESFEIQESSDYPGNWNTLGSEDANETSLRISGKVSGTTYHYRMRSSNQYGYSDFSNEVEITTHSLPESPSNLQADGLSDTEIEIRWIDNSGNEIGFYIEKSDSDAVHFEVIDSVGIDVETIIISELDQFVTYHFRVRAFNEWGESHYSNIAVGITRVLVALVAAGNEGVIILNVSDPANPVKIGQAFTEGNSRDIEVLNNIAYVADLWAGLSIIDVSSPKTPELIGELDTDGSARNLTIRDNHVFLADETNGLVIIDVSNSMSPRQVGFLQTEIYDVVLNGDVAWLAAGDSIVGVDISELSEPEFLVQMRDPGGGTSWGIDYAYNFIYLASSSAGLRIWNVLNPETPTEAGYENVPEMAVDVTVQDDYAYVCAYGDGLRIVNVEMPEDPFEEGFWDTHDETMDVAIFGNMAYIADWDDGICIIDISNKLNPREIGYYSDRGSFIAKGIAIIEYR